MPDRTLIPRIRAYFRSPKGSYIGIWIAYFIYWSGAAAVLPYIGVFYESVHLKGGQIGQLSSIPYFFSLISSVIFAFLSDKFKQHRLVLLTCVVGLIGVLFIFPNISSFNAFIPVVLMFSILSAPINPILDQMTLSVLESPGNYGKIRVGGSIGWGIMVLVTGFLIDNLRIGLPVIFYIHIPFLIIFFFVIWVLPEPEAETGERGEQASVQKLKGMLRLRGFILFLVTMVIWGIGESSISNFLFLHIKNLGGSSSLMGFSLSVSLIGEIIVFSISDRIQAKSSPQLMVLMAFLVLFAWLTGLSLIRNPNAIPVFQVFGGSGFALLQSGSVAYVNERAPRGLGTTAQAIRGGLYSGFGIGTGAIISGLMYETVGSVLLFRNMAFIVLVGFFFALTIYIRDRKRNAIHNLHKTGS